MSNCIIAWPNYLDATYYTPRVFGGSYETTLPVTNLKDELLSNVARTTDVTLTSTKFQVDTGVSRLCKVWAIPYINGDRDCQYRIRATSTIKWSGVTVNGDHSASDTTISVTNDGASSVTINTGDFLTISDVEYEAAADLTLAASATDILTLTAGLEDDVTDNTSVVCLVGDYSSPEVDTGWLDYVQRIYPMGSLPFGHESFWDGKPTSEKLQTLKIPIIHIEEEAQVVRYHLVEIDNTTLAAGYIDIPRMVISPGWQPTINMAYGAQLGWMTKTRMGETLGGDRYYDRRDPRRVTRFSIDYLDEDEALVQALEMQQQQGIDQQLFFVFDPNDVENLSRRAFLATMRQLSPVEFPVFEHASVAFELEEVI